MTKQLVVKGHTLPFEGRVKNYFGYGSGQGKGRCSCGVESTDVLPTTAARRRWHRDHKMTVLSRGAGEQRATWQAGR